MQYRLALTLDAIARNPASERDDWWIIGSAASWLSGMTEHSPRDVDLFGSRAAMCAFLDGFGIGEHPTDDDALFVSDPYVRLPVAGGLDIEVQGDLAVRRDGKLAALAYDQRVPVTFAGLTVYVAPPKEQLRTFRLFGRKKDLKKAKMFKALVNADRLTVPSA